MAEKLIGHVTHWYGHLNVAGIHVDEGELHVGDTIHVHGHASELEQTVASMEIDHHHVEEAHTGDDIGVVMAGRVREHDEVHKILG